MKHKPKAYQLVTFERGEIYEKQDVFLISMASALKTEKRDVLVDMNPVKMLYSSDISLLIQGYKDCLAVKRNMCLIGVDKRVMEALKLTQVDKLFKTYPTIEEFEITGFDDFESQEKIEFSYLTEVRKGVKIYKCSGVLSLGKSFSSLLKETKEEGMVQLDFLELGFIDPDCLKIFRGFCTDKEVFLLNINEMVSDELRIFDLEDNVALTKSF